MLSKAPVDEGNLGSCLVRCGTSMFATIEECLGLSKTTPALPYSSLNCKHLGTGHCVRIFAKGGKKSSRVIFQSSRTAVSMVSKASMLHHVLVMTYSLLPRCILQNQRTLRS